MLAKAMTEPSVTQDILLVIRQFGNEVNWAYYHKFA